MTPSGNVAVVVASSVAAHALIKNLTKVTKKQIIEGYLAAEKPFEVCVHTKMGSYMEFLTLEKNIMFQDNAEFVADQYAETWRMGDTSNYKGICVRRNCTIVYEVKF